MKNSRICIAIIIVTLICTRLIASAEVLTIVGKAKINIPTFSLNNGKYAELETIGKALFSGASYISESGTIISKYYKIKCSNGSFFVLLKTTEEQSVAQMTLPAVELNGKINVPFAEFLAALGQLGLIEYDNTAEGSFIQFQSGKIGENGHETDKEVFVKQAGANSDEEPKDAKYVRIRPKDKHTPEIQPKPVYPKKNMISSTTPTEEFEETATKDENAAKHSENTEAISHSSSEPTPANLPIPEQPAGKYSIPPELNRAVIEDLLPKK